MILYLNVIITDVRNQGFVYNRYGLPGYSRYDIFKYTLASLGALKKHWSRVVIYCQLGWPYEHLWEELEAFIEGVFQGNKITIRRHRCVFQKEWQKSIEQDILPVSDRLIWYQGNDDHVFVDYDLNLIDSILQQMYADTTPFISCIYSHWPEWVRAAALGRAWHNGCSAVYETFNHDAMHIFSKELLKHLWFGRKWGGPMNRTDHIKFFWKLGVKCYFPYRELVRHFDGYSYSMNIPHVCPPLHIPHRFFKHDMRISYCSEKRKPGFIHMNPCLPYRTIDPNGADFRYTLDDMPLFWRDRIGEIETAQEVPKKILYNARNHEKLCVLDPEIRHSSIKLPVIPADWMAPWLFLRTEKPTLL